MFTKTQLDLLSKHQKIAVACSGGIDSMLLCTLLIEYNISFSIIHCNFQLRNEDSENDEKFVTAYAEENKIPLYKTKFETVSSAKENKNSIEMEARKLRYEYFNELIHDEKLDLILLGHHKNDHIETVLMRTITGTGIQGLMGIRAYAPPYYRPLWHWNKDKIQAYAKKKKLNYCYDRTNDDTNFLRNKIRHQIIPIIREINPGYELAITQVSDVAFQTNALLHHCFSKLKDDWDKNGMIDLFEYSHKDFLPLILSYIFSEYPINKSIIGDICSSLNSSESKFFEIHPLKIEVKNSKIFNLTRIDLPIPKIYSNIKTLLDDCIEAEVYNSKIVSFDSSFFYFDLDSLHFPLTISRLDPHDKIKPLGMNGRSKKVSTIAQELGWSKNEKTKPRILIDKNQEVVAVFGYRISENVKITSKTKQILKIKNSIN